MKNILEVEKMVIEYAKRHEMSIKQSKRLDNIYQAETFCYTQLVAKISGNRIYFSVDGKRTSIHK